LTLRDVVVQLLRGDGLEFDEAGPALRVAYSGENGRFLLFLRVDEERQQFVCYALSPIEAGPRVQEAAELVCRANLELSTVAFDLDPDSGVIRCRAGLDVDGDRLTPALVSNVVHACAAALDRYLPAITAVIARRLDPRRALAALEG
jgi:hypothetical protein